MKWNELSLFKKALLLLLLAAVLATAPEFMIFLDVGGIELATSLLLINLLSIKTWLVSTSRKITEEFNFIIFTISTTHMARKRIFFTHSALSVAVLLATCSFVFAAGIFLAPTLVLNV